MTGKSWQEPDSDLVTGRVLDQPEAPGRTAGVNDEPTDEPATIIDRIGSELLQIPGVEGVGLTKTAAGDAAVVVYVRDDSVASSIAPQLGGMPTVVKVTGPIDAQPSA
jgi:hypothetical protein